MALSMHATPFVKTGAVLITGACGFAALYWAGYSELAWVAFLVAGLLWGAMDARSLARGDRADPPGTAAMSPATLAAVTGRHYTAIPASTRVTIEVRKLRVLTVLAALDHVNASVDMDPLSGSPTIRGNVPVGTFRSGNARRDMHVLGPAFLDAGVHPTIRFMSTSVNSITGDRASVIGDLTLRGRTYPVTWDVSQLAADPSGGTLRAVAETSIRRSDWGITGWMWLVDDTVRVRVEMTVARDE